MRGAFLLLALAVSLPTANAQRAGFGGPHFSGHPSHQFGMGRNESRPFPFYGAYGFFGTPFYSSDFYEAEYPVASQPPVATTQPPIPAPERTPAEPLMIELQGDRYVAQGASDTAGSVISIQPASKPSAEVRREDLKPILLIFRDGHQEEVTDYTIANGALYASANYYSDGVWTKKIELATVNIADTIATNQTRGVSFRLPASPNEVITRP